ncbi:MAG TPA: response regulator [Calditrichia bacterium]|nr:response regulator [Calditrichota bacterium]HQU72341.1 response regulator [Calditrichia bacterium]HQV31882.1 response regulator [Calditrichia bacterium]
MNLRILIVDDSSMARSIIRRSLEICGLEDIEFREAGDGKEAMEVLKAEDRIDLVFTDLNMPNMSGDQLLKRIKSSPRFFEVPVVIITSLYNNSRNAELMMEHAAAVLPKPVTIPKLSEILEEKLGLI